MRFRQGVFRRVAHLAAHSADIREVVGSIPITPMGTVKLVVDSIPATNGTRVRIPDGALDVSNFRPKTKIGGARAGRNTI